MIRRLQIIALVIACIALNACMRFDWPGANAPSSQHALGGAYVSPSGGGTSVTWANDLAGSTGTQQWVASISGNGGAGGDVAFASTGLKASASPFNVKDSGAVTRFSLETTHGRITVGKGGSDYYAAIGPTSGAETTDASIYLGANGDTQNNSTFAIGYGTACQNLASHAGSVCFNGRGSGSVYGDVIFSNANGNSGTLEMLGRFDGVSGQFLPVFGLATGSAGGAVTISASTTTPIIQSGVNATSLTIGPNKTGATLVLASSTFQTSATFDWNGNTATIPLVLNYGVSNGTSTATGGVAFTTITVANTNRTLDTTTKDNYVIADTSTATVALTLPAPSNGRTFHIIDKANTFATRNCTLVRSGTEKIDGVAATKTLATNGQRVDVVSDGTDWYTK